VSAQEFHTKNHVPAQTNEASMIDIVIDKQGYCLKMETRHCLRIDAEGQLVQRIPATQLRSVVIHAKTKLDSGVLQAMIAHQIPFVVLPGRSAMPMATLQGVTKGSIATRMVQYRGFNNAEVKAGLAALIVLKKLEAMLCALSALEDPARATALGQRLLNEDSQSAENSKSVTAVTAVEVLAYWSDRLQQASNEDEIRGIEGIISRRWFGLIREMLPVRWEFSHRNRRPPKDPVNALLSLSYSLLLGCMQTAIAQRGLDMELGFLHELLPGRPSLALDMMEPLRPWVDAFVVSVLLAGHFTATDFYPNEGGIWLKKEARGKYYALWFEWKRQFAASLPDDQRLPSFTEASCSPRTTHLDAACYRLVDSFASLLIRRCPVQKAGEAIVTWAQSEAALCQPVQNDEDEDEA
jgi:CRISPR-associated protein Cas1